MASNGKHIRKKDEAQSSNGELEQESNHSGIDENNSDHGSESLGSDSERSSSDENQNDSEDDGSTNGRSSAYSTGSVRSLSEDELPSPKNKNKETNNTNPTPQSNRTANREEEHNVTSDRMTEIKKVAADLAEVIRNFESSASSSTRTPQPMNRGTETSWDFRHESPQAQCSYSNVRPEHVRPFPSGVRPNKMWAEWYEFIENFEVAVSMHNANDPVYRSKLLYLSLGKELQAIVNASNLKPSLTDTNCYTSFVRNIENYLRSMTDTAAEHKAFLRMKQEKDESTVAFHARLVRNVKLCGYNISDQNRFVRAQLLDGLRNKELVKAARTYAYETNFIVQSSTREEAYEAETAEQPADPNIFEVFQGDAYGSKRANPRQSFSQPPAKLRRMNPDFTQMQERRSSALERGNSSRQQMRDNRPDPQLQGRRTRCRRCNNTFHRNPQCPALSRRCNTCGQRGHFAVACRVGQLRMVQQNARYSDADYSVEDVDSKQVKHK